MILDDLDVPAAVFSAGTGWDIKPEGACRGEVCVPLDRSAGFDVRSVAARLRMALVTDDETGLSALGPATLGDRALLSAEAPELVLDDLAGEPFALSSLRGQKVLLVAWAPYQGCAYDLPGWQALRTELHPAGLEVVTVSLELSGPEASRAYIEAARPDHPSLLDPGHAVDTLFGVVNVPAAVWIDEQGTIVRPPHPGWPGTSAMPAEALASLPEFGRAPTAPVPEGEATSLAEATGGHDRAAYLDTVRDWVASGAASRYALGPEEVVALSQPRPTTQSAAAAHFELADHLWRAGRRDRAIVHFTECHRLQPDNWTYKRQAWSLVGNERVGGPYGRWAQGPVRGEEDDWPFASDFRSDVAVLDPGGYYPKLDAPGS